LRPLILIIILLLPASLGAHRLDEYLQATRVDVERSTVSLDVDLTPGVSIASQVSSWIDADGDHAISPAESVAYARQVLQSLTLSVDGTATPMRLTDAQPASIPDMKAGVGTFRLRALANVPTATSGRHKLALTNSHHPESSVYLVNALVPTDPSIRILAQNRTIDQHSLTIDYEIQSPAIAARVSWIVAAAGLLIGTVVARRRVGHSGGQ
jgi:hypothetical protein